MISKVEATEVKVHRPVIAILVEALADVFAQGIHADKVIERRFKANPKWGARDRRIFAETFYDLVRWWRWYWHAAGLPDKTHAQGETHRAEQYWQVWAAYWLDRTGSLPPWDECRGIDAGSMQKRLEEDTPRAVRQSIPDWLDMIGQQSFATKWSGILERLNKPADVFLRVNTLKTNAADLRERLQAEGYGVLGSPEFPDTLRLQERGNAFKAPAFHDGWFEVQDISSQQIAPLLQVESGMRVIDACAGAGGKTLHLAALMKNKGRIIALDVHEWKLKEMRKRAARAGADNIEARLAADAQSLKRLNGSADRVLIDAPCSGLGVLRRNPDAKWKLNSSEITRLRELQAEILQRYARMVKPGGKLVYATCSILPKENELQVKQFLAEQGEKWKLEEERHYLPGDHGGDGFYAARLALDLT